MRTFLQRWLIPIIRGTAIFLAVFVGCEATVWHVVYPVVYSENSATWGECYRTHHMAPECKHLAEPEFDAGLTAGAAMLLLALPSVFLGIFVSCKVERGISDDQHIAEYERNYAGKSRFTSDKRNE